MEIATETMLPKLYRNERLENPNRVLIGQLNINAIRNKFEMLTFLITNKIVVLLLLETKIDETFLLEQFLISGFPNR